MGDPKVPHETKFLADGHHAVQCDPCVAGEPISFGSRAPHVRCTPMWALGTRGEPKSCGLCGLVCPLCCRPALLIRKARRQPGDAGGRRQRTRPEPFNFTPVGVNPISPGSPHVRPMGVHRTCGEPDEIKKNTHPKNVTALFRVIRPRPHWSTTTPTTLWWTVTTRSPSRSCPTRTYIVCPSSWFLFLSAKKPVYSQVITQVLMPTNVTNVSYPYVQTAQRWAICL